MTTKTFLFSFPPSQSRWKCKLNACAWRLVQMLKRCRLLLGEPLLQARCLLISSLCCLRLQQMPLVSIPVAPHAPLRWGIRAVDSIFPWLTNKADVLLLPSPKSALKLPMVRAAAPHWCTPPLSKAFRFAQSIFLSLGNVGKKTVLSITVNCANWDI